MKPQIKTPYYIFMIPAKRIEFIGNFVRRKSAENRASKWYYDFVLLDPTELNKVETTLWNSMHLAKKYINK
jgi:hypothetical protein